MTIVVGTTLAAFAMSERDAWRSWLLNAAEHRASHPDVQHFAALQVDGRGIEPFAPLVAELEALNADWWTYSLDDGRTRVDMVNRWRHIVVGQNLVVDYCQARPDVTHLLFVAADCSPPPDIIPRMIEMDHPLVAPYISTYELRGEPVDLYPPEWGVEDAMASAACICIARDVFRRIRWRWDVDTGMSDDPCYQHDARQLLGVPTYVRHDVEAKHYPETVGEYDTRFRTEALEVQR